MKLTLLIIHILFISSLTSAQDFIELKSNEVVFRITRTNKKKNQVVKTSDNSSLKEGFYKTSNGDRFTLFQVNDSGHLIGSLKTYDKQKMFLETLWEDGIQTREFVYLNGNIAMESFDSTVNVMLYDSLKNIWQPVKKTILIEKQYFRTTNEMRIRFAIGGYDAYAHYFYKEGKLIREIIPHFYEKEYDTSGNVISRIEYNWKNQQIESSDFKNGKLVSKKILKNKNMFWDSKGIVRFPNDEGNRDEITSLIYYSSGAIKKKEIIKDGKRTVINYDAKGKVINQTTDEVNLQKVDSNAVPPVEIKK
ncbi:hypothetical protein [Terrimonas pollutisoli]|uniref:hypothetical protein n=1 Tax=Terrimonas pollutisoli TaxID=3034147 RepID=UPI0023EC3D9D|nr:hypothetical protein [Terrimonas sp. H1YJ31]